jgi:hypothetical protein
LTSFKNIFGVIMMMVKGKDKSSLTMLLTMRLLVMVAMIYNNTNDQTGVWQMRRISLDLLSAADGPTVIFT